MLVRRQSSAHEEPLVYVKTKNKKRLRFVLGSKVQISYNMLGPHEAYLAAEHPKNEHCKVAALVCGMGLVSILYAVIRRGI